MNGPFDLVLGGSCIALALAMTLSLYRLLKGPSPFDRLTGLGLIGSKTVVLLVALGVLYDQQDAFVDISISYALLSFIGTLVLAKYFEGHPEACESAEPTAGASAGAALEGDPR